MAFACVLLLNFQQLKLSLTQNWLWILWRRNQIILMVLMFWWLIVGSFWKIFPKLGLDIVERRINVSTSLLDEVHSLVKILSFFLPPFWCNSLAQPWFGWNVVRSLCTLCFWGRLVLLMKLPFNQKKELEASQTPTHISHKDYLCIVTNHPENN